LYPTISTSILNCESFSFISFSFSSISLELTLDVFILVFKSDNFGKSHFEKSWFQIISGFFSSFFSSFENKDPIFHFCFTSIFFGASDNFN
jgi:hypothetical protein